MLSLSETCLHQMSTLYNIHPPLNTYALAGQNGITHRS